MSGGYLLAGRFSRATWGRTRGSLWRRRWSLVALALLIALIGEAGAAPLATNRAWEALPPVTDDASARLALRVAAWHLVDGPVVELAGEPLTPDRLMGWAESPSDASLERAVREELRRPVALDALLHLLDDAVADGRSDEIVVPMGRARAAGLVLGPAAVFEGEPVDYGERPLDVSRPAAQRWLPPAEDGDPLGERWTTRFPNPETATERLDALRAERPDAALAERVAWLGAQLEAQGAAVWVTSTVRDPRRGYLMWGAFLLSRCQGPACVERTARRLERAREEWALEVPITWRHPDGPAATIAAARRMVETYDVVYATERGARESNHYGGRSVDLVALGLPRALALVGADGQGARFDLSDPGEPRDLSLSPAVIEWVEQHFDLIKLEPDHPHWTDRRP